MAVGIPGDSGRCLTCGRPIGFVAWANEYRHYQANIPGDHHKARPRSQYFTEGYVSSTSSAWARYRNGEMVACGHFPEGIPDGATCLSHGPQPTSLPVRTDRPQPKLPDPFVQKSVSANEKKLTKSQKRQLKLRASVVVFYLIMGVSLLLSSSDFVLASVYFALAGGWIWLTFRTADRMRTQNETEVLRQRTRAALAEVARRTRIANLEKECEVKTIPEFIADLDKKLNELEP